MTDDETMNLSVTEGFPIAEVDRGPHSEPSEDLEATFDYWADVAATIIADSDLPEEVWEAFMVRYNNQFRVRGLHPRVAVEKVLQQFGLEITTESFIYSL